MATLKNTLIDDTGYLQLPSGTTAQRPVSPSAGYMRWNTTESYVEVYNGSGWTSWDTVSPAATPASLRSSGTTTDGSYIINAPNNGQTEAVTANVYFNMVDGKDWVEFFRHTHQGPATINLMEKSIPWKGYCIEDPNGNYYYTYFNSFQVANSRNSSDISTGGNRSGYKVYLGYAGGHGIYNSSANTCSWSNNNGGVGAGYDGSCGSFSNDLRMGTSGSPYVSAISGTWKHYLWMDNAT